ncbi:peptide chain release factor N(5)-glutamine methyltransferase [Verrucomicrobiota bacterium sgz303538]
MKTVLEVIQATTAYFAKHNVESPRLNIEHLLAHVLGKRRMDLYLEFDRPLSDKELEPLRDLVRRRTAGEPLQHLLGTVEFLGRTFISDKRALIPRPETEQLCEILLEEYKGAPFTGRVLDVGTGSGIIALTLAASWPEAQVEAVDLSENALSLTKENAQKLELTDRVRIYRSNLLKETEGKFDLIVANLPYIAAEEIAGLAREVQHDPRSALDGGPVGTEIIFRLIEEAKNHLTGRLALEIGHDQSPAVSAELANQNYHDIKPTSDYQGRNRYVFAKYG